MASPSTLQRDVTSLLALLSPAELVKARDSIHALLTTDALREANEQLSPLLGLSQDVLHRIVTYTVTHSTDVCVNSERPGILHTCHALRTIALRAYFSQNTFKRKRRCSGGELARWVKDRVGEHKRLLRKIRVGPPAHCNNEEAECEAGVLEEACGLAAGTVWCLSEDDYENDFKWWVNSLGETEKLEESAHDCFDVPSDHSPIPRPSTKPAASWYCASWARGQAPVDYFSLRRAPPTPESRPGVSDLQ